MRYFRSNRATKQPARFKTLFEIASGLTNEASPPAIYGNDSLCKGYRLFKNVKSHYKHSPT
jgi:hypothetical protein